MVCLQSIKHGVFATNYAWSGSSSVLGRAIACGVATTTFSDLLGAPTDPFAPVVAL